MVQVQADVLVSYKLESPMGLDLACWLLLGGAQADNVYVLCLTD